MERVYQECLSVPDDKFADLSTGRDVSCTAAGWSLRELGHDFIEPTATIRWLARAADAVRNHQLQPLRGGSQKTRSLILRSQSHAIERFAKSGGLSSVVVFLAGNAGWGS